ncbi:hypothetical protein [Amycolatopsis magusensis]|uniref:hypothetical protein n=1 Tax=Amycolatopsis magusensis TaxID=882444 RepID=UPI003796414D
MPWSFRQSNPVPERVVRISEVGCCKPSQLRVQLPADATAVWAAGTFTDIGLTGARDLDVPIARRFRSVGAMCAAAVKAPEPQRLVLLMSEPRFQAHRADQRLRAVVDRRCQVLVLHGWLAPPSS